MIGILSVRKVTQSHYGIKSEIVKAFFLSLGKEFKDDINAKAYSIESSLI